MDYAQISRLVGKEDQGTRPSVTTGGSQPLPPAAQHVFVRSDISGCEGIEERWVAAEVPIGIEINGIGYAVLLGTPRDIADLAIGFAMSDRLIAHPREILNIDIFVRANDIVVRMTVSDIAASGLHKRIRHRSTDSSCGLCGIESLEQVLRPLPKVIANSQANDAAIFAALSTLDNWQHLNGKTRAVHGAALCGKDGRILMIREDVGRHNAFDKLIGAMYGLGMDWDAGFALLTSRCSYELVEKAAMAACPLLVTISGATGLAISRAAEAGLPLRVLARPDALLTP